MLQHVGIGQYDPLIEAINRMAVLGYWAQGYVVRSAAAFNSVGWVERKETQQNGRWKRWVSEL